MEIPKTIVYRPRGVIKHWPFNLDPDEIGLVFDKSCGKFYVCPPDMSSDVKSELEDRWRVYFELLNLIPTFEHEEPWFANELQRDAFLTAANEQIQLQSIHMERIKYVISLLASDSR